MKAHAAAALLSALPLVWAARGAADSPSDPVLQSTHGGASARRNRFLPWHPVRAGTRLQADMELMCEQGCTVRTSDGSTVSLANDALVTVGQVMFVPLGLPQAALGRRFELREGNLSVSVSNDTLRPHTVVIAGPNDAVALLRPGQSQLVASAGRFGVACVTGSARVKMRGKALSLRTGEATAITDVTMPLLAKPLAGPPRVKPAQGKLGELQPLAVALSAAGARPGLEWEPVAGASGYEIDIAADAKFRALSDVARVDGKTIGYLAKNLIPGTYWARVISFDEAGLASLPSEPKSLRVVAVQVPSGSAVDSARDSVIAPPGTALKLANSDTLEMAREGEYFSAAPADIVVDAEPRTIRLRQKGDFGHETRFIVEPRGLRAEVRLTPFWARWPGDPIDVLVTLGDPTGRIDPNSVEPELEVLLGVEPITLEWQREGNKLRARIDSRIPTGPAVVRVIVKDRDGAVLGRNFLEIEPIFSPSSIGRVPLAHR